MVSAWRIVKRKHAKKAFDGEGARLYGGRWNPRGVAVVYTAESQSLAALEMVVHLDSPELLDEYVVFEVGIAEPLITRVDPARLPKNWRHNPPPPQVQEIGGAWVAAGTSAVLQAPSATLPVESNYLLNPAHPDFVRLRIGQPSRFLLDARLVRKL
ncbi:MAG: RES family NAD+ phosphorylase [Terriglobia bacterium]